MLNVCIHIWILFMSHNCILRNAAKACRFSSSLRGKTFCQFYNLHIIYVCVCLFFPFPHSVNLPKDDFKNLRTNLSLTECDISSLSVYGDYMLRVRAESEDKHSNWAVIKFKPMDDSKPYSNLP